MTKKKTQNLPTLAELINEDSIEQAFKNDQFKVLVNQQPPDKWIKKHPHIKHHSYLPIDKVEYLLKRLFKSHRIEWKETKLMMNSIFTSVRVHYQHPLTGEWEYQDGVGSAELQTKKDTGPLRMDMSNVNPGAVPMATGISKSVAIKDACDLIGDIFGGNLNRKDTLQYSGDRDITQKITDRVNKILDACETVEDVEKAKETIPPQYHELADALIDHLNGN